MDPKEGRVPKFENRSIRVVPARSCTSCQLSRHWVVSRFICLYMSHFHCDLMNLISACSYLPCIWIRSNLEIFKRATTNIQSFWLGRYLALACSTFWGRGQQAMESSSLWAHCPNLGSSARTSICIAETCNFLGERKGAIILLKQSFAYICICIIKPEAHEVSPSQTPAGLQSPREALHGYHRTRKHKNQPVSVLFLFGVRRQCPLCGRSLLQLQRRLFGIQQTQVDPLSERNYAVCEVFHGWIATATKAQRATCCTFSWKHSLLEWAIGAKWAWKQEMKSTNRWPRHHTRSSVRAQ